MSECPRFVTLYVHFRTCIFNILQWSSTTREVIGLFIYSSDDLIPDVLHKKLKGITIH
jgi:hypothetical protein